MSDVLLCAKPRLRPQLERIANALRVLKLSVAVDEVAAETQTRHAAASAAKVVVVGWTDDCFPHGGDSSGEVLRMAAIGRKRGVLVPVLMEPTAVEQPWRQIQTYSLMGWAGPGGLGSPLAHEWLGVVGVLGARLNRPGLADYVRAEAAGLSALTRWAKHYPDDPLAADVRAKADVFGGGDGAFIGAHTQAPETAPSARRLQARRGWGVGLKAAAAASAAACLAAAAFAVAPMLQPAPAAASAEAAPAGAGRGEGFALPDVRHVWADLSARMALTGGDGAPSTEAAAATATAATVVTHAELPNGRPPPPPRVAPAPTAEELAAAGPLILLDVRSARRQDRAPIVRVPSRLPDFALFRECEECPEMIVLPAGTFLMGSPATEPGRGEDEDDRTGPGGVQARVSLPRFALARYETTWEEWRACVQVGGCDNAAVTEAGGDNGWGWGRRPVIEVTVQEPAAYAAWLSARTGGIYRLPTEAEWEYAAKAGGSTPFPWGAEPGRGYANYGSEECCAGYAEGRDEWIFTAPVGSFPANAWGLFDMNGNVMEWVEDCYRGNLANQPADGAAWVGGSCSSRVLRGGSWDYQPEDIRSSYRLRLHPDRRFNFIGFRLARTL